ncbi:MAG: hypothetical protein Q8P90_02550 [bacterium]|nr:hypothetical protein [bacterium]
MNQPPQISPSEISVDGDKSDDSERDFSGDGDGGSGDEHGCCIPFCSNTGEKKCVEDHGGTWTTESCAEASECESVCCVPFCSQTTSVLCEQQAGTPESGSCETVDECEVECCTPQCDEMSTVECEQRLGTPQAGSCADIAECSIGCCQPFGEDTTELVCEQKLGESWTEGSCRGFSVDLRDEKTYPNVGGGEFDAKHEFSFKASTCNDDIYTIWDGVWDWTWTVYGSGGENVEAVDEDVQFIGDDTGTFNFLMGDTPVTGHLTENSMDVSFVMPGVVGEVSASGPITIGADCAIEENY